MNNPFNLSRRSKASTSAVAEGHTPHLQSAEPAPFEGYTLDEIRTRRVINELKINMAKERIRLTLTPREPAEVSAINSAMSGFQNFMRYADIALVAFTATRRAASFLRKFRSARKG